MSGQRRGLGLKDHPPGVYGDPSRKKPDRRRSDFDYPQWIDDVSATDRGASRKSEKFRKAYEAAAFSDASDEYLRQFQGDPDWDGVQRAWADGKRRRAGQEQDERRWYPDLDPTDSETRRIQQDRKRRQRQSDTY